ncbi:hypothetical protein Ade02nite_13350 [Paractinoplanes deccanensis]|uniref:Carrier domain-containing protein n=1 Tax=Paractinoplanes deccanensis TaxID=113561 RepID=A0ABQ3XY72_9ACTN|nr:acyl carrier protein [Actinoplanes deccanensis]GID72694.1 hypothetical protein Ade02nite_13350 [Actinoplanes deccanensis]
MSQATITAQHRRQLRDLVADVLELEPGDLTETSSFVDEHGADSLQAIEILARLERDLGVLIPQEDASEMTTLAGVYAVVARHAGWATAHG